MITDAENVADYVPFYYLFTLIPLILLVTTTTSPSLPIVYATTNVHLAQTSAINQFKQNQFIIYRLHQIDLFGNHFGSQQSLFNLEIITSKQLHEMIYHRKCILFKFTDLLYDKKLNRLFYMKIIKQQLVSGVMIIYNQNDFINNNLIEEQLNDWQFIENKLLTNETSIPVYFIEENPLINQLYDDQHYEDNREQTNDKQLINKQQSAFEMIKQKVFYDSFQLVVNGPSTSPIQNPIITSFQTKLIGAGLEDQMPTYLIVTHYDSYSIIPSLTSSADANASGVIVFLELMRIFSKLYSNIKTRPKANLLFLLTGGGKLNYFGTKKWLDDNFDSQNQRSSESDDQTLLDNIKFAMCLDSLADTMNDNNLYMVVSKPPKPQTKASIYWQNMQKFTENYYPTINVSMIHKKINLAEDHLYWEHERFSLKRLTTAFTLTTISSSKLIKRRTIIDSLSKNDSEEMMINKLENIITIVGETLSQQLYDNLLTDINEQLFMDEFSISKNYIKSLLKLLKQKSRQQSLLLTTMQKDQSLPSSSAATYQLPSLLKTLYMIMKRYSDGNVRLFNHKTDSKNPEFIFYEPNESKLFIYKTKPAIFDLFITMSISLYLLTFFMFIKYYDHLISIIKTFKSSAMVTSATSSSNSLMMNNNFNNKLHQS